MDNGCKYSRSKSCHPWNYSKALKNKNISLCIFFLDATIVYKFMSNRERTAYWRFLHCCILSRRVVNRSSLEPSNSTLKLPKIASKRGILSAPETETAENVEEEESYINDYEDDEDGDEEDNVDENDDDDDVLGKGIRPISKTTKVITPPRNRGGVIFSLQFVCVSVCV